MLNIIQFIKGFLIISQLGTFLVILKYLIQGRINVLKSYIP